jgi:flagellar biosynthetic protein FliQ
MNEEEIIELIRHTIMLCIQLSAPVMLVGLVVGTSIALIQALTQIQEVTLVFVPKILSIFFALFFALPMMTTALIEFMQFLADKIIAIK